MTANPFAPTDIPPPLAAYNGERPPAPAWFTGALANRPERSTIDVEGAAIELLTWGQRGKPGLLLLHGNGAHAHWWDWTAPFFTETHRVAAISWSGMGGSDWRESYSADLFAAEMLAGAEAAGLFDAGPPVFVGHSFGGFPLLVGATKFGERLAGVVSVDSPLRPPELQWKGPPRRNSPNRVYPTLAEALARFRYAPPQTSTTDFIADHIARGSLKEVTGEDGAPGWTWRFDPFMTRSLTFEERSGLLATAQCPLAFVWGERSQLFSPRTIEFMREKAPDGTPFVPIPDSDHHVMVDQPLALVSALRALLAVWPDRSSHTSPRWGEV